MNATNKLKTPKKIFFIHTEGIHHLDCVEELRKQGLECVLISQRAAESETPNDVGKDLVERYAKAAPDAVHLTLVEACFAETPRGLKVPIQPATERDLEALAPIAVRLIQCLEYSNFPSRPSTDLYRLYVRLVGLWRTLLDELKPDAVVFNFDVSLRGFDYVLYELCRADKIPQVILCQTLIRDQVMPVKNIYEPIGPSMEEILAAPPAEITGDVDSPVTEDTHKIANDPARFRKQLRWGDIARVMLGPKYLKRHSSVTWFLYNPTPRWAEVRFRKAMGRLLARQCLDYYDSLVVAPDWSSNFVYFPLQVQPEESTGIQGEHFSDLWHQLSITSMALPPGWRIYVKEHPNQFNRSFRMEKGRNLEFYEWISKIPNVSFVAMETSAKELVARSRAVVTCAGSTGWEALKVGKPAVAFGYPWYMKAPGLVRVNSVESCRAALAKVADGTHKVSQDLVQRYENLMREKYTFPLVMHHEFKTFLSTVNHKAHAQLFTRVVVDELTRQGVPLSQPA